MPEHSTTNDPKRRNPLTRYERIQVGFTVAQTVVYVATLIAAIYIGISQNRINQNLLDLNFLPSVEIAYSDHRMQIYNKGKENIWFFGSVFNGTSERATDGRLISPGGFYYILGDRFEPYLKTIVGADGETRIPFDLLVKAANGKNYTVKNTLFIQVVKGVPAVHTQTLSITPDDWSKRHFDVIDSK